MTYEWSHNAVDQAVRLLDRIADNIESDDILDLYTTIDYMVERRLVEWAEMDGFDPILAAKSTVAWIARQMVRFHMAGAMLKHELITRNLASESECEVEIDALRMEMKATGDWGLGVERLTTKVTRIQAEHPSSWQPDSDPDQDIDDPW